MSREDVDIIERSICPGEGACGGMYTANTMASAAEALGMSLPGSASPRRPTVAVTDSPGAAVKPWWSCCGAGSPLATS